MAAGQKVLLGSDKRFYSVNKIPNSEICLHLLRADRKIELRRKMANSPD
jgi:hypothetical protein